MIVRRSPVRLGLRRAFMLEPVWTTRQLMAWSHPRADWGTLRQRRNRARAIRRAAAKIADRIGLRRGRGGGTIWKRREIA